jgi:hypothetical protein
VGQIGEVARTWRELFERRKETLKAKSENALRENRR